MNPPEKHFHLYLVSDATGETVINVARACLVQFAHARAEEHVWTMVRTHRQVEKLVGAIQENPGVVLYTLVNADIRNELEEGCRDLGVLCVPVLDPVIGTFAAFLDEPVEGKPGRQYVMDAEYFTRIDAMQYVLSHDDGQLTRDLDQADVIVLGVSRTSKTPTCIYLANRGIKAANVPVVPGVPLPSEVLSATRPLVVGLTKDPKALIQVRRNRMLMLKQDHATDYTDLETVTQEVNAARRLFSEHGWPIIDVTRRSIEETAAAILQLYSNRRETAAG
jgi:regulator of PEP synthase PpsR (kinase-PPPase family)